MTFFNIVKYDFLNDEYRVIERREFFYLIKAILLVKFIECFIDNFFNIFF